MDDDDYLLSIALSSSDESTTAPQEIPRDHQSEESFRLVKATWKPKTESGDIWKSLNLPLDNPSKPESQTILHAIEELYFFKRYDEALLVVGKALVGELQDDFRRILEDYSRICKAKVDGSNAASQS